MRVFFCENATPLPLSPIQLLCNTKHERCFGDPLYYTVVFEGQKSHRRSSRANFGWNLIEKRCFFKNKKNWFFFKKTKCLADLVKVLSFLVIRTGIETRMLANKKQLNRKDRELLVA